ncbi:MAG: tetratricopeptide repeat protein [Muribaculaceae bacterium]|nr:tetratricopeptide repeat protein [Muribaculaceae bacterium]
MDKEIEQEIQALSAQIILEPENALALYRRGSLYWKLERRAEAITDFNASANLDPEGPGAAAAAHAQAILDFFNPQNP